MDVAVAARIRSSVVALLAAVVTQQAFAAEINLQVLPLFEGTLPVHSLVPVVVDIQNEGPDLVGNIHVSSDSYVMDYPVECPRHSRKVKTVYVPTEYGMIPDGVVSLVSNRGYVSARAVPFQGTELRHGILGVGGSAGELAFTTTGAQNQRGDAYVAAQDAPPRIMAYAAYQAVYLGEGSERVSDDAVRAIRHYVLQGGTLVVPSGTVNPLLTDGRWSDLMPVVPGQSLFVSNTDGLAKLAGGVPRPRGFAVLDFSPKPGAQVMEEGGVRLAAVSRYGLGRVVFLAFNPVRGNLREWEGRRNLFRGLLVDKGATNAKLSFESVGESRQDFADRHIVYQPGEEEDQSTDEADYTHRKLGASYEPNSVTSQDIESTFTVEMPDGSRITMILAVYFLVVIPVNFVVLHLMKKREWGWVTAPLISLVFAGIILGQARSLYNQKTAATTSAMVVAQQGAPSAIARGRTLLFFAAPGRYDLQLERVDSVSFTGPQQQFSYVREEVANHPEILAPTDVGEVKMPAAQPPGLTLTDFRFTKVVEADFATVAGKGKSYVVTAKQALSDAVLVTRGDVIQLGDLKAGETTIVERRATNPVVPGRRRELFGMAEPSRGAASSLDSYAGAGGVVLCGTLTDFSVGPKLGESKSSKTTLLFFAKDPL